MVRVYYRDNVAWLRPSIYQDHSMEERAVRDAVAAALPTPPAEIKLNPLLEYVKVEEGQVSATYGEGGSYEYVEYAFNVQGETLLPLTAHAGSEK